MALRLLGDSPRASLLKLLNPETSDNLPLLKSEPTTIESPAPLNPQDALTPAQKILTDPRIAKIIDSMTGGLQTVTGMNPQEQMQAADRSSAFLQSIPKMASEAVPQFSDLANPPKLLDRAANTLGVVSAPFVPLFQGAESGIQSAIKNQDLVKTLQATARGVVDPASVKLMTDPENMPLQPFEREGGVAPLIPRAIANAVEQLGIRHLVFGNPVGKAVGEFKLGKQKEIIDSVNADLPKLKELLKSQNKDVPGSVIDKMTAEDVIRGAQENPQVGDYLKQKTIDVVGGGKKNMYTAGGDLPKPEDIASPENLLKSGGVKVPFNQPVSQQDNKIPMIGEPKPLTSEVNQILSDTTKYKDNLKSLRSGDSKSAHIGDIPDDIAKAKEIPSEVHIDWKAINKIKEKHKLSVDDSFVDNLNSSDLMIFPKDDPAVINFVKKSPDGKDLVIATRRFNGHFVVTGFEAARKEYVKNLSDKGEVVNIAGRPLGSSIEKSSLENPSQQELSGVNNTNIENIAQPSPTVKSSTTLPNQAPEEWSDNPISSKPAEFDFGPTNISDKAEMELEMMSEGNVHPLEKAMKQIGGVKFGDIEESIPSRFKGKKASDEAMQELENNYGIKFSNDSEFHQALKSLGNQQMRFGLSDDVQTYLKNKKNVEAIDKKLSLKLKPGVVKKIVHSYVGVKKPKTHILIQTTEQQVLKHMMKMRQKASKEGFEAGRVQGRKTELEKRKEREQIKSKKIEESKRFNKDERKALYQRAFTKGLIIKTEDGKIKDRLQGILRYYKKASFDEIMNYLNALNGEQGNPPAIFKISGDAKKDADIKKIIDEASSDWQDINRLEIVTLDLPRMIEKVTGVEIFDDNVLADNTYEVLKGADDARFEKMNEMLQELSDKVKGIHEGTKVSADLMKKIESDDTSVEKERKYFHEIYDDLIKKLNEGRAALGKKPIEYRKDYFTHIRESNLLNDFFRGDNREIDKLTNDQLKALSKGEYAKISVPFNKFAQKREGNRTKYDAIGNFKKYLETALYEIYMSPAIKHARTFTDYALLKQPNAKTSMDMLLNELAGKPSQIDSIFLRPIVSNKILKALNSRFGANALVGNISYMLTNASNIGTVSGELGRYTIKGMHAFLSNKELRQTAFKNSSILKSRKSLYDSELAKVDAYFGEDWKNLTWWENVKLKDKQFEHILTSLNRIIEYNNVGSAWVGAYLKAIDKFKFSPEKAYKYADSIARKTQGGYRPYEVPAYMRSDTGKLFSKFGTWSFNMMNYFLYDLGGANIPKNIVSPITKAPGGKVKYSKFLILVGTLLFINAMYKKMGLREPYNPQSFVPQTPFTRGRYQQPPMGKMVENVKTIFTGGEGKKEETKAKARAKAAKDTLFMLGPRYGGAQLERFFSGDVIPNNENKKKLKLLL